MKEDSYITLNKGMYPLYVGGSAAEQFRDWDGKGSSIVLEAQVTSNVFDLSDVVWFIEDTEIADFDFLLQEKQSQNGKQRVRARRTGVTTVTAQLPNGTNATCILTIIDNFTRTTVTEITLNTQKLHLRAGKSATLTPILYPKDIFQNGMMNHALLWESRDENVSLVKDGKVIAVGEGETDIIVRSADVNRVATCHIKVSKNYGHGDWQQIDFAEIKEISVGEDLKIQSENPTSDGSSLLVWQTDNQYIANVDEDGKVRACSPSIEQKVDETGMVVQEVQGIVWIYATAVEGGSVTRYPVRVVPAQLPLHQVSVSPTEICIPLGESRAVTAAITPFMPKNCSVLWESSQEEILTVTSIENTIYGTAQAIITAKSQGDAIVTASYGDKKGCSRIRITESVVKVQSVKIEKQIEIDVDQVYQFSPIFTENVTDKKLHWLGTDFTVATIDREGNVQGYGSGECRIYAIADDSLSPENRMIMKKLQNSRKIPPESKELQGVLSNSVYAECVLHVRSESVCLRNLHVVEEARTNHSILLLWNRASLLDTGDFDRYMIYCNGELIAQTQKLGYRAKNLKAITTYQFQVTAVDKAGKVLEKAETIAITEKQSEVINVLDYGAVGDGRCIDTFWIQKAINDCPKGGTVWLPKNHIFVSGALFLKSNMTFQLDGILFGSSDPKDYPRVITRWEGWRKLEQDADSWENSTDKVPVNHCPHASLLNAGCYEEGESGSTGPINVENLVICGNGQVNANGFTLAYNEGPNINSTKVVSVDYPVKDATSRGSAIRIHNGRKIYVKDIQVAYAPGWTIHTIYCEHITFDGMEIVSQGDGDCGQGTSILHCGHIFNGDGIDPESCVHLNMFDILFTTGDDAVAIKSGRGKEGNELDKPNAYFRITDCISRWSLGGFGTGSETASGSHDLLFQNLEVEEVLVCGIWIKTCTERGGITEYIQVRDMVAEGCTSPVWVLNKYTSTSVQANPSLHPPIVRHLTFENVHGKENNERGFVLSGAPECVIQDVQFRGVSNGGKKNSINLCENIVGLDSIDMES